MKITDLPELLDPTDDDVLPIDDSPASNAATKKVTRGNLVKGLAKQTDLTAHTTDTTNPHAVTAAQVGAPTTADLTAHTGNAAIHRQINDTATSATALWSSSKISSELDGKAETDHTHTASQVTDFATAVSDNADVAANTADRHTHANKTLLDTYDQTNTNLSDAVVNKHSHPNKALLDTYTQTEANLADAVAKKHTHANQSTLDATTASFTSGKDGKLSGIQDGATANDTDANLKNRANHTGTQTASTISDFNTAADARITAQKGQNGGLATLGADSKVPSSQLPAIALTDVAVVVSQAAQLALTAQEGDVAVRTDLNKSYVHNGGSVGTMADWTELATPTDAVQSVNGQTGSVSLTKADVGLSSVDNTSDVTKNAAVASLTNKNLTSATNTFPTFNQSTTGNAATATTLATARTINGVAFDGSANITVSDATKVPATRAVNTKALSADVVLTQDDVGSGMTAKQYTATEQTKLAGIATAATANSTDAQLRDRSTHTGAQTASTISDFQTTVSANTTVAASVTHAARTDNPHGVTKAQVGLSAVDNTSDVNKPVSTAQQTALNLKANDNAVMHLSGAETVTGAKTFNAGTLLDKGTQVYNIKAYGAVGDARKVTDGVMTASSGVLSSATAAFVSGDVGKRIIVTGADASAGVLTSTIASYQSATQVTLTAAASTSVSGAPVAFGTDDLAAMTACLAAIKSAGGGRMLLMQSHITSARLYYDRKNLSVEGWPNFGTTMYCGFDPTSGVNGVFTFYSDDTTTIGNISVRDVVFDHMGCRTPGVYIRGNTSTANVSKNFYLERLESVNRVGSADGVLAGIVIYGKYTGVLGSLKNVHITDFYSHDNTAATGTKPYSINILSEDLDGLWVDGRFENLYGTTIAMAGSTANLRARKNFNFDIRCFQTKKRIAGDGTYADIFDANRTGFHGIDITGTFDDNNLFARTVDNFHIAIYESIGLVVHDAKFYNSRAVIAPGYSTPTGHENYAWTFNNNLVMDAISFADSDGQIAGMCSNNTFVRVQSGPIIFGYGLQTAQKTSHGNVFYNCITNPDTSTEWAQAIFLSELGGQDYDGNIIYDDLGAASKLKYVFTELHTSGDVTHPNTYRNNKIMGGANLVKTFYLESEIKHEIIGNTGVKEQVIQNSVTHNSPAVSPLVSTDVVSNNWRADGSRVTDNVPLPVVNGGTGASTATAARNALGTVSRTGDYMSGQLVLGQGYALQFTGSSGSFLNAGNNGAIMRGAVSEPFTISCRIQLDPAYSSPSGSYPLMSGGRYYLNITSAMKIRGGIWGGANPTSTTTLVPGGTYDIVFDWDGATTSISLNGVVENSIGSTSSASGTNNLYLGKRNGEVGTEFKGILDSVRMWNRQLTSTEKATVAAGGTAPASGLVLELGFDLQSPLDTSTIGNVTSNTGTSYATGIAAPIGDGSSSLFSLGSIRANGPIATALATKSAAYTLTATDSVILADATSAVFTCTLPTAVGITGRQYTIKRINAGSNNVTVGCAGAETIDGATTYSLTSQYQSITVVSNNVGWLII